LLVGVLAGAAAPLAACAAPDDDPARAQSGEAPLASDETLAPGAPGAALVAPTPCPTSGKGALVTAAPCFVFPPTATGASSSGANAGVNHYALAPTGAPTGKLVLFLNPSLGSPAQSIGDPATNVYTAAVAARDHVLGLSYPSDQIIGRLCSDDDACFLPTRTTIVTGTRAAGTAPDLRAVGLTDSIHGRAALALAYLAATRPGDGWAQYLVPGVDPLVNPAAAVQWSKVIAMGHSQGGGHAALLARMHPLARLVVLSSPCDEANGAPASWLTASAAWQTATATAGYGFAAASDTTCGMHTEIWDALALAAARRFENAASCAGASAHTATTQCPANMARVQSLVTP
jgi:hypothetical protein